MVLGYSARSGSVSFKPPSTQAVSGTITAKLEDATGNAITSTTGALDVNIKSGSSAGTQYAEGTTVATPTGTVALAQDSSNVVKALALDTSGNLNVNVQAGGTGGNASVSATAAGCPAVRNAWSVAQMEQTFGLFQSLPLVFSWLTAQQSRNRYRVR